MGLRGPRKEKGKNFKPPTTARNGGYDKEPPHFALQHIQASHCLSACDKNEKSAFADTIHKLSQKTWMEIKNAPRHGIGFEKISRKSIKVQMPSYIPEDAQLISFRFCAKAPMVGYRKKETFYVLWLDRDFSVYDH